MKHVLVVDDDEGVRDVVSRMLKSTGYDVSLANDGKEATKVFQQNPHIAIVFSDVMMPRMTGDQFHRAIHDELIAREALFIAMTGYCSHGILAYFERLKVPILKKPFGLREVIERAEMAA